MFANNLARSQSGDVKTLRDSLESQLEAEEESITVVSEMYSYQWRALLNELFTPWPAGHILNQFPSYFVAIPIL